MTGRKGRPRKSGPRYPCGQRVSGGPSKANGKPNRDVLERRLEILGVTHASAQDLRAAENPLDAMAARGWIDPALAAAGHAYAGLCRSAGQQARRVTLALDEAPETSGVDTRRIQDMSPDEIAAVWTVVEKRRATIRRDGDGDPVATGKLQALWSELGASRSAELYAVCVLQTWPVWVTQKIAGKSDAEIAGKWLERRAMLVDGLTRVRARLHPRKPRSDAARDCDHPFLAGPEEARPCAGREHTPADGPRRGVR